MKDANRKAMFARMGKKKISFLKTGKELSDVIENSVLWERQYQPRIDFIRTHGTDEVYKKFKRLPIHRKIIVIDNLQKRGFFTKKYEDII